MIRRPPRSTLFPLHDALPICEVIELMVGRELAEIYPKVPHQAGAPVLEVRDLTGRSEEHTSELQSLAYLVCRLLLEKKKKRSYRLLSRFKLSSYEPSRRPYIT